MPLNLTTEYKDIFAPEYERHLLAILARAQGMALRYRSALSHEYFTGDLSRAVALALLTYVDANQHLPAEATLHQSTLDIAPVQVRVKVEPFIHNLYKEDITDAAGVMTRVVEFGRYAALVNAVLESANRADNGAKVGKNVIELGRSCHELITNAMNVGHDLLERGRDWHADLEKRAESYLQPNEGIERMPTGIRHLDAQMGGGLGRGKLGSILAVSGVGKTTFLINVGFAGLRTAAKRCVVHFSMELDEDEVLRRYDDRLIGGVQHIRNTKPAELVSRLLGRSRAYTHGKLFVKYYPTGKADITTLRRYINLLISEGHHPDVIIVDYPELMKCSRLLKDPLEEEYQNYLDLRALAGEFDAATWAAAQVNRAGAFEDTAKLANIQGGFKRVGTLDAGLTLSQTKEERIAHRCRIYLEKYRGRADHAIIECELRRGDALIRSTGRYDAAYNPLDSDSPEAFGKKYDPDAQQGQDGDRPPRAIRGGGRPGGGGGQGPQRNNGPNRRVGPPSR